MSPLVNLLDCPSCGLPVDKNAMTCPRCHRWLPGWRRRDLLFLLLAFIIFVWVVIGVLVTFQDTQ